MNSDFLVIGGGIAGVSAAARLSAIGHVVLLEAEDHLAHHASGRSAALFEPGYGAAAVKALNIASEDHLRHAQGGVLSARGMMLVASADEAEAFHQDAVGMTPLTIAEAIERVPILNSDRLAFAAIAERAWDIDTDRLIQNFVRDARGNGAEIVTSARVSSLRRDHKGWHAETSRGPFSARRLVNAAGPWANALAAMAGVSSPAFTPMRRSMARIPAPGGRDVSGWPMLFGAGESWYAKPDAGALIVSPAEEHPMEPHDAWADDMVLAEGLARYEAMVNEPVTRLLASWAGLRTFAPDRVLVIGPDPADEDFLWNAGQGGYGFQTAPAASALLADLAAGRRPALDAATVAALSPARFAA